MGEESCIPPHSSMALSSNASHGGTPPTLLAQRLDILMTTHRLAMGLYLPCLRPQSSSSSQSDPHFNVIHETSPKTHQARVGALTAAHGLLGAGKHFVELACARPDLVRRKDGLGLSLCCGLVTDVHSGILFSFPFSLQFSDLRIGFGRGVEMGYSKALFDASIVCATSALRDPGAVWARTAMEDAKMGLGLLRDLRDLCPALDVSVLEALIRKLDSGGSGAGSGPKRKREGWDEGDGRDAVPVPGGSGAGGNGEENAPLIPIPVNSSQEQKLRSSSYVGSNSNTAENASFTNNANKDNSASEPRRTYPAIVIPSKFPPRKDRVKDRDLLKDGQRERERGDKDKDRSREKDKDRKKMSYPSVGFRVRPGKEPSPLARVRTTSIGAPTTTTTHGISGQSMPMSSQPIPVSDQPMPTSSQPMSASQHSAMSQPPSVVPLQPSSLVSTPVDRSSYHSTPTSISQEGGVDFSLPFGAAYEPQSQVCFPSFFYPSACPLNAIPACPKIHPL
jgi:hypothetical protein